MYIIPITPFTRDLIALFNGGIRPEMEQEPTYYLLSPTGSFATIIGEEEFKNLSGNRSLVTISYITE